jgi:tetratricopeptide (TPR) repeat protein
VFSLNKKILSITALSGLILFFSISSYYINKHWKTEESFWKQSVKYGAVALAHQNYGLAIVDKNPELAEIHYLEAIRQDPFHIYANINLGLLHIRMGKEAEGLQRLREMVALNPNWSLAYFWLSKGLKTTGNNDEALKQMLRAADLDPRSLRYQYEAARALQKAGKRQEAIPYFERVINLDPNYKSAGFWLGFTYQKTGQSQNAIDTYNYFLQSNPDHVQGHFNLAYELMTENCKTAVMHFNQVLKLQPRYMEAHLHLSRCYKTLGDEQQAAHHLSKYKTEQKPSSS